MTDIKLYRVKAVFDTVIAAESEAEAIKQVQYGMGDIEDEPVEVRAMPILTLLDLPNKWGGNCLPWGDIKPQTIEQILKQNK